MQDNAFFSAASPESLGIPSDGVIDFLEEIKAEKLCMHGFIIIRHGKIAAEGYYKPFAADRLHRMYSSSKSFVSVAIGLLCGEGKLSLDDPVIKFFPDKAPASVHPYVAAMKIRDLLRMASAYSSTTYGRKSNPDHDWVRTFFTTKPSHVPGTVFCYDTSATTTLGAVVERVTGMPFLEYLQKRVLNRTGFSKDAFCVLTPNGEYSWGGSGVNCTLRDLARFALLALDKGKWNGEQLIGEAYMEEATAKQIDCSATRKRVGYGYQFWRWPENGFGTSGMGLQNSFCFPEQDMILATIADTQSSPNAESVVTGAFIRNVLRRAGETLPQDKAAQEKLGAYLNELAVQPVEGAMSSSIAPEVSGKTYRLNQNRADLEESLRFKSVRFEFCENGGSMFLEDDENVKEIKFGFGGFASQDFPGFNSAKEMEGEPVCVYGFGLDVKMHLPCMASAAWVMPDSLMIECYAIGTFLGTLRIQAVFKGDSVTLFMVKFAERFWEQYQGFQSGHVIS